MPPAKPIKNPASYVPTFAVGYSEANGELAIVASAKPLPVTLAAAGPLEVTLPAGQPISVEPVSPPAPAAFSGTSAINTSAGPFIPVAGRPVVLTLSGSWQGIVQLARSIDGGTTRHPVTIAGTQWGRFTANACEPVWEEQEANARLYLEIARTSGTVAYRLAQ